MLKSIIIIFFAYIATLSASQSCYSVELWSVPHKKQITNQKQYFDDCQQFHIGNFYSMRCGCYEHVKEITTLKKYQKNYPSAYITKTLKSRFHVLPKIVYTPKKIAKFNSSIANLTPSIKHIQLQQHNDFVKMIEKLSSNRDTQIEDLQSNINLVGLSLEGKYDQYAVQNYLNREYTDFEYNIRLKYDILKDGYFQHQTEVQENIAKTEVEYYQNLINLQKYNYNDNLNSVESLLSKINVRYYETLIRLYNDTIQERKKFLKYGVQTKYDVDELLHARENLVSLKNIYLQEKNEAVNITVYELLRTIENEKLVQLEIIQKSSKDNSTEILMQNAKLGLLQQNNTFYKDITLNVYTSYRAMDEVGYYATVGAELDIPLNFNYSETKRLNTLKERGNAIVSESTKKYLDKSIQKLYTRFYTSKALITASKSQIKNILLELDQYKTIAMYNLPNLDIDFKQKIFSSEKDIINIQYQILQEKVNMLKALLNISYISNTYDIKKLLEEKK